MSTSIDNRVVQMQFDNKNFEKNVGATLKSLDKLQSSLELKGAAKGFDELDKAAKRCDISKIGDAADAVKVKLSTMSIVGMTYISNLTNKAISAGERILSAFTIDPFRGGFSEYELKMGSVQTIIASTGESLAKVNDYLEQLNIYSDKTIYSFADMTNNIGKFTNAGVKLDDAVKAIKGISNEAAVSGANANEASRAMYNFSQALSAGYVKLIDWKSIENANMATREFKQELIDTAVELGTLKKQHDGMYKATKTSISATKNFNDSLQEGWLTSEVLITTLGKYADETTEIGKKAYAAAQDVKTFSQMVDTVKESVGSGWAQAMEIMFGDLVEAKKLWTGLGSAIGNVVEQSFGRLNSFLETNLSSGYKNWLSDSFVTDVGEFEKIMTAVAKSHGVAIDEMIDEDKSFEATLQRGWATGAMYKEGMLEYIDSVNKMSYAEKRAAGYTKAQIEQMMVYEEALKANKINVYALTKSWRETSGRDNFIAGIKGMIKPLSQVNELMGLAFKETFGQKFDSKWLFKLSESFRDWATSLKLSGPQRMAVLKFFEQLFGLAKSVTGILGKLSRAALGLLKIVSDIFGPLISSGLSGISKLAGYAMDALSTVGNFLVDVFGNIDWRSMGANAKSGIGGFIKPLVESMNSAFGNLGLGDGLIHIPKSFAEFKTQTKCFIESVKTGLSNFGKYVNNTLTSIGETIESKLGWVYVIVRDSLKKILSFLDEHSGTIFTAGFLGTLLYEIVKFQKMTESILGIVKSVTGSINSVTNGINRVFTSASKYIDSKIMIDKAKAFDVIASGILKLAVAIGILAASIWVLSKIPKDFLLQASVGVVGITMLVGALTYAASKISKTGLDKSVTKSLFGMGFVLMSLSLVLKSLNKLNLDYIGLKISALGSIMALYAVLLLALKKIDFTGGKKSILSLIGISFALLGLVAVLVLLSKIKMKNLGRIFTNMALVFGTMFIALKVASAAGKYAAKAGMGLLGLSAAMLILLPVMMILGKMRTKTIAKAAFNMTLIFAALDVFIWGTSKAGPHALKAGASLILLAIAMVPLTAIVAILGMLDPKKMRRGVIAMSVMVTVLGLFTALTHFATPNTKSLIGIMALVISLGVIIAAMSLLDPDKVIPVSASLAVLMITLSGLITAMSLLPVGVKEIGKLLLLGVVVGALGLVIAGLTALIDDVSKATKVTILVSGFTLALEVLCAGLAVLGLIGPYAIAGTLTMVQIVVGLIAFVGILGALNMLFPQIETFMNSGIPILTGLGAALGGFIGGFIGGFANGVLDSAIKMAETLDTFLTKISSSASSVSIPDGFGTMMKDLGSAILSITAADIVSGIGRFLGIGGNFDKFADDMKSLGSGLSALSEAMGPNPNLDAIRAASEAGVLLSDMAKNIPNMGGKLSNFFGDNTMAEFGAQFEGFGSALAKLSAVEGIDVKSIQNACEAGTAIADMAKNIPNMGGKLAEFFGDSSMTVLAGQFYGMGSGLKTISDAGGMIDLTNVAKTMLATKQLSEIAETISNTDTSTMASFKTMMTDYVGWLNGLISGITIDSAGPVNTLSSALASMTSVFDGYNSKFRNAGAELMKKLITGINSESMNAKSAGRNAITKFANGISDRSSSAESASRSVASRCASALGSYSSSAYDSGYNFVKGFANGIKNNIYLAENAAKDLGDKTVRKLNTTLEEHSPSRITYRSGEYFGIGYANGISSTTQAVQESVKDISNASLSAMSDVISNMSAVINSDMDLQPVIRPVVDLSEVESSTKQLSAMYNQSQIATISAKNRQIREVADPNAGRVDQVKEPVTQYIQNNYSPKALSRIDIYRNTKNLISMRKGR